MDPARRIKLLGRECGFDLVRIAEATEMHAERVRYLSWIADGRQAEMRWITEERAMRSTSLRTVLPEVQSIISVGMSCWSGHRSPASESRGKIARYAWGSDYHSVLGDRLKQFSTRLQQEFGGEQRWYVDTGPTLDRAFAARSGLGWYGKNTNIITEKFGSFVLLGEILTTLDLPADVPLSDSCGSCRLCLVACPTGAIGPEYSVDSRRCISYLTIEHRGPIPLELRPLMGDWVFGCDICQEVCPPAMKPHLPNSEEHRVWASGVRAFLRSGGDLAIPAVREQSDNQHPLFADGIRQTVDLFWLLRLTHEEYLAAFGGTAIKRAKAWMLRRNAAIALGNVGDAISIGPLLSAILGDEHPVVRGHAAWAVGRLSERLKISMPVQQLRSSLEAEPDESVREELQRVIDTDSQFPARRTIS